MPHTMVIGRTGSGKTLLSRQITDEYTRTGILSLVLDPIGDVRWHPYFKTKDPALFLHMARGSTSCALWMDESGMTVGQHADEMFWLATAARHLGHASHFVCQRAPQVAPTVRDQCQLLICFAISDDDARDLSRDWGCLELREAPALPMLHYLTVRRFGAFSRGVVQLPAAPLQVHVEGDTGSEPAAVPRESEDAAEGGASAGGPPEA